VNAEGEPAKIFQKTSIDFQLGTLLDRGFSQKVLLAVCELLLFL